MRSDGRQDDEGARRRPDPNGKVRGGRLSMFFPIDQCRRPVREEERYDPVNHGPAVQEDSTCQEVRLHRSSRERASTVRYLFSSRISLGRRRVEGVLCPDTQSSIIIIPGRVRALLHAAWLVKMPKLRHGIKSKIYTAIS